MLPSTEERSGDGPHPGIELASPGWVSDDLSAADLGDVRTCRAGRRARAPARRLGGGRPRRERVPEVLDPSSPGRWRRRRRRALARRGALRQHYQGAPYARYRSAVGELLARPSDVTLHHVAETI